VDLKMNPITPKLIAKAFFASERTLTEPPTRPMKLHKKRSLRAIVIVTKNRRVFV